MRQTRRSGRTVTWNSCAGRLGIDWLRTYRLTRFSARTRDRRSKGANGLDKMACEEYPDAASRVCRVLVFVTRPYDDTEHTD